MRYQAKIQSFFWGDPVYLRMNSYPKCLAGYNLICMYVICQHMFYVPYKVMNEMLSRSFGSNMSWHATNVLQQIINEMLS